MNPDNVFDAAKRNDLEKVKIFIEKEGVSPKILDRKSQVQLSLAQIAAEMGYLDMLKYLLEKDSSLLTMRYHGNLLDIAVEHGYLEIVKYLVENHNANIYKVFRKRFTAINWAIVNGHLHIIKYFIEERNVDVNKPPIRSESPKFRPLLFDAIAENRSDIITYLIEEKKTDLTVVDGNNENILYMVLRKGNLKFIKYILDKQKAKIDINWKNNEGYTLVHVTVTTLVLEEGMKILQYLIREKHADFDIPTGEKNWTPLHCAVSSKMVISSKMMIKYLVECGADLGKQDINGDTALHLLFFVDNGIELYKICKYLCEHGANVNQKNNKGESPLAIAVSRYYKFAKKAVLEACKILIDHGANINYTNENGENLVHIATIKEHDSFLKYLGDKHLEIDAPRKTDNWTPLHCAAFLCNLDLCKYLIEHGADLEKPDINGNTALHLIFSNKWCWRLEEICKYLCERGAHVNWKNNEGETPMDIAISQNKLGACKVLSEHGANNIEWTNENGETLAHLATMKWHPELLAHLGHKHVNIINTPRKIDYWTPLHCAASMGNFPLCKDLIKLGADCQAKSNSGRTPAQVASSISLSDEIEWNCAKKRNRRSAKNFFPASPRIMNTWIREVQDLQIEMRQVPIPFLDYKICLFASIC